MGSLLGLGSDKGGARSSSLPSVGGLGILRIRAVMQIYAEFDSHEELVREFENNLGKARAFVLGEYEVTERQAVDLVLIHPLTGEWLPLNAEVVYIASPSPSGVGLEILDWSSERSRLIEDFVNSSDEARLSLVLPESPEQERFEIVEANPHLTDPATPPAKVAPDSEGPSRFSTSPPSSRRSTPPSKNVQERVRKLNIRQRETMARGGTLTERVALERAYGAAVWDGLLANAALTGPEVARIAKNGNATLPHLTLIVGNAAWLTKAEVRRALLTNPRLTPSQIERVLRALPPAELKQIPKQTAYPPKVRAVAMRLLP